MIEIRPMTIEDAKAVHQIDRICFSDAWSLRMFEELFQYPTNYYFVAEEKDVICGFAGISASIDTADIMNIAVLPECRRRGIGQKLLTTIWNQAKECGCEQIMLEVRESNTSAQMLYANNGFQQIAVRKDYYANPRENGIIMQRSCKE